MFEKLVIPRAIDARLRSLASDLGHEFSGVLICTGVDADQLVANTLLLTGAGKTGKIITEGGHLRLVQEVMKAESAARLVQFRTTTMQSVSDDGAKSLIKYLTHFQKQRGVHSSYVGMVVTPENMYTVGTNKLVPTVSDSELAEKMD